MKKIDLPKYVLIILVLYVGIFVTFFDGYEFNDASKMILIAGIGLVPLLFVILLIHKAFTLHIKSSYFLTSVIICMIVFGFYAYLWTHLLDGIIM